MDLDTPERNPAGPDRPPDENFRKERETKDDGRYIIFYSFGHGEDEGPAGEEAP